LGGELRHAENLNLTIILAQDLFQSTQIKQRLQIVKNKRTKCN